MRAALPANEDERIEALRALDILDSAYEGAFDDLALLAAQICGTPIAVISLVDHERQWFKSHHGLAARETTRDLAFCAHAILEPEQILVVPDATADERFADNALVTGDPHIRFYAGAPLITPTGAPIGTLCVIDHESRTLSPDQLSALGALSRQVMAQLTLRQTLAQRERDLEDLRVAQSDSRDLWRALDEHAMVVMTDLDGVILSVNDRFTKVWGYSREEAIGQTHRLINSGYHPPAFFKDMWTTIASGRVWRGEILNKAKDGTCNWVNATIVPCVGDDGKLNRYVAIRYDINDRKLGEVRLRSANEELAASLEVVQSHARTFEVLSEMAEVLQSCAVATEAYDVLVRAARQVFPGAPGSLLIRNEPKSMLEVAADWSGTHSDGEVFPPSSCWALRRGRVHWALSAGSAPTCQHVAKGAHRASVCSPMIAHGELMGILTFSAPDGEGEGWWTPARQRNVMALTERAALALANLRLRETLKEQSLRDQLTGLYNRRFMVESLDRELTRMRRRNRPLGVLILDVDHFKALNDRHGHIMGDAVLRDLGEFLGTSMRKDDVVCRYGGEEFVILMPEADREAVLVRAERLRIEIAEREHRSGGKLIEAVTVSVGAAFAPEHGLDSAALLNAADQALYVAKRQGRNRVMCAPEWEKPVLSAVITPWSRQATSAVAAASA